MKQVGTRKGGKRLLFSLRYNRWLVSSLAPPSAALPGRLEQDSGEKAQRKRQVTEGESGGAGQCQLCAETLRTAGPQSDAEPQRRAGCEVRGDSRERLSPCGRETKTSSLHCRGQHRLLPPACPVSQTPTSCCLTVAFILL